MHNVYTVGLSVPALSTGIGPLKSSTSLVSERNLANSVGLSDCRPPTSLQKMVNGGEECNVGMEIGFSLVSRPLQKLHVKTFIYGQTR